MFVSPYNDLILGACWSHIESIRNGDYSRDEADKAVGQILTSLKLLKEDDSARLLYSALLVVPDFSKTDFFMGMTDISFEIKSTMLLITISNNLNSPDADLVRAATACLVVCGGITGKTIISQILNAKIEIPHKQVIAETLTFYDYGE